MDVMHIDWHIYDGCDLRDADMSEKKLNGAHFIGVDARGAFFLNAELREANFEGANLRNAYFVNADLRNAHFQGADLRGTVFTGADLRGALLQGCITDEHTILNEARLGVFIPEATTERLSILRPEAARERKTDSMRRIVDFDKLLDELATHEADVYEEDED
jgi:uncharacterized protein YjbI with pentapeptide repeats